MIEPTLLILPDPDDLAVQLAEIFVQTVEDSIRDHGVCAVALSGGGTPQLFYELLATADYADRVDWSRVHLFWGDERCVPADADGSNYKQANDALISKVPIPQDNVWRVRTEFDCEIAAHDYMRQMEEFALSYQSAEGVRWPVFDFALLGMGGDGHTASIFPHSPIAVDMPTRMVSAEYDGRPANRVTITETVFNDARRVYFLVTGAKKAQIVADVIKGNRDFAVFPAQRIRPKNGLLTFALDAPAARLL